jgi:hypothetical protein
MHFLGTKIIGLTLLFAPLGPPGLSLLFAQWPLLDHGIAQAGATAKNNMGAHLFPVRICTRRRG